MNNQTLVLYTSAVCNLNCTYCYIDKNPILLEIDKKLNDSFQDLNYYFNFSKEIFSQDKLTTMQFWGGEPSGGLHRITPILSKFLNYYPNLDSFMMSTNLTLPTWFDETRGFLEVLKNYPRNFILTLQLSLDGPAYITDKTRGKNTTELFLKNYSKLIEILQQGLPKNIRLNINFKPTLSSETISCLQTKEKVLDYFIFFDKLIDKIFSLNNPSIVTNLPIPNTACPSPHSTADGFLFQNYCKLCYEISKDNIENNNCYFQHYKTITSFVINNSSNIPEHCNSCGTGIDVIGLLPEFKLSVCHSGFTDLVQEYKILADTIKDNRSIAQELFTNTSNVLSNCLDMQQFKQYQKMMTDYNCINSRAGFNNLVLLIRMLAVNKQIHNCYAQEMKAKEGALFYISHTSNCMRDNINTSGTILIPPVGLIKLLLNGAKEYIDATERLL